MLDSSFDFIRIRTINAPKLWTYEFNNIEREHEGEREKKTNDIGYWSDGWWMGSKHVIDYGSTVQWILLLPW